MRAYFLTTDRIGIVALADVRQRVGSADLGKSAGEPVYLHCGRFFGGAGTETPAQRGENLERFGVQYYPIFALQNGDWIGCCHLRPEYWRQGLANEALSAMIADSRDAMHVRELRVGHRPENSASRKLIHRLGFAYVCDKFYPVTGIYHPEYRLILCSLEVPKKKFCGRYCLLRQMVL